MEELWYEWRPFIFLTVGVGAILYDHTNRLLLTSGLVLFFTSGFTLKSRLDYRKTAKFSQKKQNKY